MTYPLNSPGTSVTISDESVNATAGQGTIPLIIIGTHEYKSLPSGAGIAEGTLPENANVLYPITSQRELLQTFGNPIFYNRDGSSVHGYELNEYGLHAAYQYLGIANRAYVVRAGVDFGQLTPRSTAPRAEADNGTLWFDTNDNAWGIYEWTGSQWASRDLYVLDSVVDLDDAVDPATAPITGQFPPLTSIGVDGDFAMVVLYDVYVLYQKLQGAWFVVGSTEWSTAKTVSAAAPTLIYETYIRNDRPSTSSDPDATTPLVIGDVLIRTTHASQQQSSASARWNLKAFNGASGIWDELGAPIYNMGLESNMTPGAGSFYVGHHTTLATFQFRVADGLAWSNLAVVAGVTEPTTDPVEGTLWFNNANIVVDIQINQNGIWVPYRQPAMNALTDPNGVIMLGSPPISQSGGAPLVDHDLWIDTSDMENFPKMYRRWDNQWISVNIEDSTDPVNGMAFGEVSEMEATNFPHGMKLYNLEKSTNTVKSWNGDRWETVSGYQMNGVPYFGRKAQRQIIVTALAGTITSNENIRSEGLFFNLIAAPGYIELIDEMVTLNTDMKEIAFIVGDTPVRLAPTGRSIQEFAQNAAYGNTEDGVATRNPYVGMYYPWGLGTNVDGSEVMIPPSTIALRTIAYSDANSYQWLAPAGFTRGLVTNASAVGYLDEEEEFKAALLNEGQRDMLYLNNINPIAYIPNRGLVVWGQKTRHNLETALNRINVARLVNYLRFNLDVLSKPFLFEPNDQQTRDSVKITFERFLSNLVGLRGLYDFVVVCDDSNNTPERIDRNELWVDIAIQPVKAVEFIYIPVRIVNTGDDLGTLFNN